MIEQFIVEVLLVGSNKDLTFEVRQDDFERLQQLIGNASEVPKGFGVFDCVNGNSVALNLSCVQGMQFQSDLAFREPALVRSQDSILVCLRDREPLELSSTSPIALFDIFMDLESGLIDYPYTKFDDTEDRPWIFAAREVVWASGPTHLLLEGSRLAAIESGLLDESDDSL